MGLKCGASYALWPNALLQRYNAQKQLKHRCIIYFSKNNHLLIIPTIKIKDELEYSFQWTVKQKQTVVEKSHWPVN